MDPLIYIPDFLHNNIDFLVVAKNIQILYNSGGKISKIP